MPEIDRQVSTNAASLTATTSVDVVFITALDEERDALLSKLPGASVIGGTPSEPEIAFAASLNVDSGSPSGGFAIRLVSLGGMGRVRAALATNNAIKRWQPTYVIMVGIAGGFQPNAALGDVLVSTQIVDYELQRVDPRVTEFRPTFPPISHRLLHAAQNYLSDSWRPLVTAPRPADGASAVRFGPMASGDKVVNDPVLLARLQALAPKMIGVEMEAGGVGAASQQAETNFFMIRGVSDLANGEKDSSSVKQWRSYACDIAASFAIGLFKSGLVQPRDPASAPLDHGVASEVVRDTARAINTFDSVTALVETVLHGSPTPREHRMTIEGGGIELVAKWNGQVQQTITANDLQRLPSNILGHVRTLEQSMETQYRLWQSVYPQMPLLSDPFQKAQVEERLKATLRGMKQDLLSLLEFLEACGFHLDDHYQHIRHLVATV